MMNGPMGAGPGPYGPPPGMGPPNMNSVSICIMRNLIFNYSYVSKYLFISVSCNIIYREYIIVYMVLVAFEKISYIKSI